MSADVRPFMERLVAGEIVNPEREILDEIDLWHVDFKDGRQAFEALPHYLGMSDQEYRLWVENRASLEQLLERRKAPDETLP